MRKCNTTGPCFPDEHYMLPALDRLPGIRELVAGGNYFVIHAPRQTGKTTALKALVREIYAKGEMIAVYCTLETIQKLVGSYETAMREIRHLVLKNAGMFRELAPLVAEIGESKSNTGISTAVMDAIQALCVKSPKPIVVFFDEIDCLVGDVLVSFLRQLRDGYVNRDMMPFPKSVALVGMLDVRDYKAQIRPDGESLGQISPFNIIAEDMLIPNFIESDIRTLYAQHTAETGQVFADGVVEDVWRLTRGQPWLVNAIAHECVEEIHGSRYDETITVADVEAAKEAIIRENPIHLDYLFDMVNSPWVRSYFDACLQGTVTEEMRCNKQFKFLHYLGFLREEEGHFDFANRLYKDYWNKRTTGI